MVVKYLGRASIRLKIPACSHHIESTHHVRVMIFELQRLQSIARRHRAKSAAGCCGYLLGWMDFCECVMSLRGFAR